MKIGKPTTNGPQPGGRGKYAAIWAAAGSLKDGEWLPVEFDSTLDAQAFQQRNSTSARARGFIIRKAGGTATCWIGLYDFNGHKPVRS